MEVKLQDLESDSVSSIAIHACTRVHASIRARTRAGTCTHTHMHTQTHTHTVLGEKTGETSVMVMEVKLQYLDSDFVSSIAMPNGWRFPCFAVSSILPSYSSYL